MRRYNVFRAWPSSTSCDRQGANPDARAQPASREAPPQRPPGAAPDRPRGPASRAWSTSIEQQAPTTSTVTPARPFARRTSPPTWSTMWRSTVRSCSTRCPSSMTTSWRSSCSRIPDAVTNERDPGQRDAYRHHLEQVRRRCSWVLPTRTRASSFCSTVSTRSCPAPDAGPVNEGFDLDTDEENPEKVQVVDPRISDEAVHRPRVQARGRSLRSAHLHTGLPRHAAEGRVHLQHARQPEGQGRPARADALGRDGGHRGSASAGDIVALFGVDCHSGDTFTDGKVSRVDDQHPRAGCGHPATPSRRRTPSSPRTCPRRSPASRRKTRRSAFASDPETGETDHQWHGRAAPRRVPRAHAPGVQGAGRVLASARGLPRDHHVRLATVRLHPQEADGWVGPVRSRGRSSWSPSMTATTSSSTRSSGGCDSARVHPVASTRASRCPARQGLASSEPPITGVKMTINDGKSHAVDSSDMAFQAAGRGAFRDVYPKVQARHPRAHHEGERRGSGGVPRRHGPSTIMGRRGVIVGSSPRRKGFSMVDAEVPLAEMFGYSTDAPVRATQGKAEFTMEFSRSTAGCPTRSPRI